MKKTDLSSFNIQSSEITPKHLYENRRKFLKNGLWAGLAAPTISSSASAQFWKQEQQSLKPKSTTHAPSWLKKQVGQAKKVEIDGEENVNTFELATSHNNFYEFGFDKTDPKDKSWDYLPADPWSINITGEVEKDQTISLEDLLKNQQLQERIYRLRCVEAWSMVLPWVGIPLHAILSQVNILSSAKYVSFETVVDKANMPGQASFFSTIDWPYREGLRIDEAMHDLTFLAVGMYGEPLPMTNGAPVRLVVPWKYGFKSIKSIAAIRFTKTMPPTTWNELQPREYGFYANVNPTVEHPRWSQERERRLPSTFRNRNWVNTRLFNGYADLVSDLYSGMNLRKNY